MSGRDLRSFITHHRADEAGLPLLSLLFIFMIVVDFEIFIL